MNDKYKIQVNCRCCNKEFLKSKSQIPFRPNHYCSLKCKGLFDTKDIVCKCKNCDKEIIKKQKDINKVNNVFCSMNCAGFYTQTHKNWGGTRSKLEVYLEEQVHLYYPDLKLICNSKEAINFELDFYFLDLKFAIELNGIFHYEPIYGDNKLTRVKSNDKQKFKLCYENDIELCVIDSSSCKRLNQYAKDKYWNIFKNLLEQIKNRI